MGVDVTERGVREWVLDVAIGGIVGGLVGAIGAVNFVIFTGIEEGYQASLVDVFDQNVLIGVVTVLILSAGPVLGVVAARRRRKLMQTERDKQAARISHTIS